MIQIKDIHKEFDNTPILKGITTEFERGKTNLVIGQSGSGKTVLLKILLGLFTPNQGEIYFDGIPFSSMTDDEHRILRREIGMVFQGSALFDSMSVVENVLFPMRMLTKLSEAEMVDQAETVIERVNLIDAKHKLPNEISGKEAITHYEVVERFGYTTLLRGELQFRCEMPFQFGQSQKGFSYVQIFVHSKSLQKFLGQSLDVEIDLSHVEQKRLALCQTSS